MGAGVGVKMGMESDRAFIVTRAGIQEFWEFLPVYQSNTAIQPIQGGNRLCQLMRF